MENQPKADEENIPTNSGINQSNTSATQQPARQEHEPKTKCECPPGCVGLSCCS